MKKIITLIAVVFSLLATAQTTPDTLYIDVNPPRMGSATPSLMNALAKARKAPAARPKKIRLRPGATYELHRVEAIEAPYFVSNTTAKWEAENETKHVGWLIKNIDNLTIDGRGAKFVTKGEITPWVIDGCKNVAMTNFSLDADDPSVAEMTVEAVTDTTITARVHPRSRYAIVDGKLHWQGHGWDFTDGIAQIHNPAKGTTLRTGSPVADARAVRELEPGVLQFTYTHTPSDAAVGATYEMRHSFRTEVAGLINQSSNVTLQNINLHFLGNFGIVAQTSTNITYSNVNCRPAPESGRVNAGFADFMQVSGCRGLVKIEGCHFAGSHDDPINVHGTHLQIISADTDSTLTLRYMHPQTRGFQSFFEGDTIAIVDSRTLLPQMQAVVRKAIMLSDTDISVTLDRGVTKAVDLSREPVVENVSWCPSVEIKNCRFTLTPTRGILVTTWRPVLIEGCEFVKCPMSAVLIADDARSWYESGAVKQVQIINNTFTDCANPVILIAPEVAEPKGAVHSGITIEGNTFNTPAHIKARSVTGLVVRENKAPGLDVSVD